MLAASCDGGVTCWNPRDGELAGSFKIIAEDGSNERITAVKLLPSGSVAASTSSGRVHIYDTVIGERSNTLVSHDGAVLALAALPDGRIAAGCDDGFLRIFSGENGTIEHVLPLHVPAVSALAVLPDGSLACGTSDGDISVWNAATGRCIDLLEGLCGDVEALVALADGRLVSSTPDNVLRVWDIRPFLRKCVKEIKEHSAMARGFALLADGRLVSAGDDGVAHVWEPAQDFKLLQTLKASGPVSHAVVLKDGRLALGGEDASGVAEGAASASASGKPVITCWTPTAEGVFALL